MWSKRAKGTPFKSTDSLIGHGGTLEGKVHCDTNLRIEGTFSGEIQCSGTVTVGEQGTVRSSIIAEEIVIAGKVYGDVTANRRLIMTGSGELHGNISASTLHIMEGSLLNGSVDMKQPADPAGGHEQSDKTNKTDKAAARAAAKAQNAREAG
jgi:cytoskeletal protein CcmA (bactofilin family)